MDILLALASVGIIIISMITAAWIDVKKGEVPDQIWIFALASVPFGLLRLWIIGFLLLYVIQFLGIFIIVLLGFHFRVLGGADGKAILIFSLGIPWPLISETTILFGALLVFLSGYLIIGIQSMGLILLNYYQWLRIPRQNRASQIPERKRFWFTRRLYIRSKNADKDVGWKRVEVPLLLYFLMAYFILLVLGIPQ